jgi:hypothetical protein
MRLDSRQFSELIKLSFTAVKSDTLGCDGCYEMMDQFAQANLDRVELSDAMRLVRTHIEQCKCCRDEYQSLLTALREVA